MLLSKFCQLDPNMINVEDETLRVKVMVAIHAARACEVRRLIFFNLILQLFFDVMI
jgi:hypothetical protein